MTENEIGTLVIETAISVHRELGPGLPETVYEVVLARELNEDRHHPLCQRPGRVNSLRLCGRNKNGVPTNGCSRTLVPRAADAGAFGSGRTGKTCARSGYVAR